METDMSKFVTLLWILKFVVGDGTILKCLTQEEETIRIKCPHRYVIFNPSIVGAIASNNTCSRSNVYCTGLPKSLRQQLYSCHWRKQCNITFHRNDTLHCDHHQNAPQEQLTFVEIEQPYCIPKGLIIDNPMKTKGRIATTKGVIRSHKKYPQILRRHLPFQRFTINLRPSYTLFMTLQRPTECDEEKDIVLRRIKDGRKFLLTNVFHRKLVFHSNDTDSLEVTVKATNTDKNCSRGFILPFSSYRTESLADLLEWPKSSFSVIKDLEWIFEVRAVIEHCTVDSNGKALLACKDNELIYSPEFSVAGYTRYQPICLFGKYPCGGHTPMTLVQRNSCFWKTECSVTWNGQIPILVSKIPSCIGYAASVMGFYGHRCVPKEQIFDMCSNCSKTITSDWGIIRSHPSYPWFFTADVRYSKRKIQIGRDNKLLLIVQDMNLDPDGRDKFSLIHKTIESVNIDDTNLPVVRQEQRIVMKTKAAKSGVMVEVRGGTLDVIFRPYKRTKGGRGFVLVFKKYKVGKTNIRNDVSQLPSDGVLVSDAAKPIRLRMNRRRCSGRGRRRRRGRACRARVWTDFFTKLE